eukprot:GHVL01000589.1.p1 GENE.GHVL01000589.1~~GHVL01000589.1.p1  ORF type:complete len:317 (+),score=74.70 GHVL01000589.1:74-1024(+)
MNRFIRNFCMTPKSPTLHKKKMNIFSRFKNTLIENEYKIIYEYNIPEYINRPDYAYKKNGLPEKCNKKDILKNEDLVNMKKVCKLAARALQIGLKNSVQGATTEDVDRIVTEFIISEGAYPSGVNFHQFPKAICASPNEVVCHGIPDLRPLADGDIVNYDVTVYLNGFFGDCSAMSLIGNVDEAGQKLCRTTYECLMKGISVCGPNVPLRRIGEVINDHAIEQGFSVVSDFGGHFIGRHLQQYPVIDHIPLDNEASKFKMQPGHTFTIEPMLCEGRPQLTGWSDGWTVVTADNGRSAQWEHTILITDDGYEILTLE